MFYGFVLSSDMLCFISNHLVKVNCLSLLVRFEQALINARKSLPVCPSRCGSLASLSSSAVWGFMTSGLLTLWWDTAAVQCTELWQHLMWRESYPIRSRYLTGSCWACWSSQLFWESFRVCIPWNYRYIQFFFLQRLFTTTYDILILI